MSRSGGESRGHWQGAGCLHALHCVCVYVQRGGKNAVAGRHGSQPASTGGGERSGQVAARQQQHPLTHPPTRLRTRPPARPPTRLPTRPPARPPTSESSSVPSTSKRSLPGRGLPSSISSPILLPGWAVCSHTFLGHLGQLGV